jgi:hypothetical protein
MSVARILVRLDLRPGLLKDLTIETVSGSFIQPLDYEGIPFRCHRCHIYGHGVAECKFPFKGKLWGSTGEDLLVASRRSDLATGVSGDISVEATKVLDSGLGRGWHPCTSTGIGPLGKGTDLSQVQKSTKKACPRSLLLSGKLSTTNTSVVSNLNSDFLFRRAVWGMLLFHLWVSPLVPLCRALWNFL